MVRVFKTPGEPLNCYYYHTIPVIDDIESWFMMFDTSWYPGNCVGPFSHFEDVTGGGWKYTRIDKWTAEYELVVDRPFIDTLYAISMNQLFPDGDWVGNEDN